MPQELQRELVYLCEDIDSDTMELENHLLKFQSQHQGQCGCSLDDIFFIDSNGNEGNLLHIACSNGHIIAVKLLLKLGFSVKKPDENGNTGLHVACYYACNDASLEIIKLLLDHDSESLINAVNQDEKTALYNALWVYDTYLRHRILRLLVDRGATYNSKWGIGEKMISSKISMMQYLVVNPVGTRHLLFTSTSKLMKAIISSGHSDTNFHVTLIEPGASVEYDLVVKYLKQIDDSVYVTGSVVHNPENQKLTEDSLTYLLNYESKKMLTKIPLAKLYSNSPVLKDKYISEDVATTVNLELNVDALNDLFKPQDNVKDGAVDKMNSGNHC